jgi:hypothetical protein
MTDFERLLHLLAGAEVRFLIVGGIAATVHGGTQLTEDLDIVYDRSPDNLERLAEALGTIHPYLRGAPPGLPFRWDAETLSRGLNFTLTTDLGWLDLLGEIAGGGTYSSLLPDSVVIEIFGIPCRCLTLQRLIRAKRDAGRPKDLQAVAELESLLDGDAE